MTQSSILTVFICFFILLLIVIKYLITILNTTYSSKNNSFSARLIQLNKSFEEKFWIHFIYKQKKLNISELHTLIQYNNYYRCLSPKKQMVFQHRAKVFLENKKIVGKSGLQVTQEMRVILAGIATQLCFGLKKYKLPLVQGILLFPAIYQSKITKNWHKGEFHPRLKYIAFSWEHVLAGIANDKDNLNLALHEFAHALIKEVFLSYAVDKHFLNQFLQLNRYLKFQDNFTQLSSHPYFRPYAQTNIMEFYAVAIEHFFETPEEFKTLLPRQYRMFTDLLNNNTAEIYQNAIQK